MGQGSQVWARGSQLAAFSHSTFDVRRSMFDVHFGSGLSGLGRIFDNE